MNWNGHTSAKAMRISSQPGDLSENKRAHNRASTKAVPKIVRNSVTLRTSTLLLGLFTLSATSAMMNMLRSVGTTLTTWEHDVAGTVEDLFAEGAIWDSVRKIEYETRKLKPHGSSVVFLLTLILRSSVPHCEISVVMPVAGTRRSQEHVCPCLSSGTDILVRDKCHHSGRSRKRPAGFGPLPRMIVPISHPGGCRLSRQPLLRRDIHLRERHDV